MLFFVILCDSGFVDDTSGKAFSFHWAWSSNSTIASCFIFNLVFTCLNDFEISDSMLGIHEQLILIVFLLRILLRGPLLGKCSSTNFRNHFPILVFNVKQQGGCSTTPLIFLLFLPAVLSFWYEFSKTLLLFNAQHTYNYGPKVCAVFIITSMWFSKSKLN